MLNLSRSQPFVAITFAVLLGLAVGQATPDNSTTTAAPVTTPKPTTTTTTTLAPPTTTSTTAPPTTTSTTTPVPPTTSTTPAPAPPAPAQKISGNVTTNNYTCIRYEFDSINLFIQYPLDHPNKTETMGVANISLPIDIKKVEPKDDVCAMKTQAFSLAAQDTTKNSSMSIQFVFASNSNSVVLESLTVTVLYNNHDFPDVNQTLIGQTYTKTLNGSEVTPNFNVEKTHSYSCGHVSIPKTDAGPFHVAFKGLRIQAFIEKSKNGEFSSEHNCQSEINDVVPIAVGAALTGLVIIVMIAYFIGRRRSRRLAYQSV